MSVAARPRPKIAFFEYADVFEDFYPHYGVGQREFATRWRGSGNHACLRLLQRDVGDVTWCEFSVAPEFEAATHDWVGCTVRMFPSSALHRRLWKWFYLSAQSWRWRRHYAWFALPASYLATLSAPFLRWLRRDRPDVLFVQDYANGRFDVLLLLARLNRIPLVAYHSGSRPERYVGAWLKRWTIRRADRILVSSERELELLARRFGVARERLAVVLTPIDTEAFRPLPRADACRAAGLDPSRRYVLFVGRFDDRTKRIRMLIDCFAALASRHPDTDLVLVGEGRDADALRAHAQSARGASVRFAGWIGDPALLCAYYNAAECLVLPSRSEGFPTVVGEAMACGTPVVGTDVGGIGELVRSGETGWLLQATDDDALASELSQVLSRILDDAPACAGHRAAARTLAERRVSAAAVADAFRSCFEFPGRCGR